MPSRSDVINSAIAERQNILIAGAWHGKTTLLSTLCNHPTVISDRCIVVEYGAREILINAPNCVRFQTSPDVTMPHLIELAMQYRPDRLIIGDIMDHETAVKVVETLSGYNGSFSCIHAGSVKEALTKLEFFCLQHKPGLRQNPELWNKMIARAFNLIIFIRRNDRYKRVIREVARIDGYRNGEFSITYIP